MSQAVRLDPGPNKDQSLLKLVAVITMIIDHVGAIFFPSLIIFRVVGRIAFPLFAWGIAIGAEKTKNWRMYALRLFLVGVVTQPFYMLALRHSWSEFNVMATLLLGLLALSGIRARWYFSQVWAPVFCLLLAAAFRMDYGWRGVLLIILMYFTRASSGGLAALMTAFCLYWGGGGSVIPRDWINTLTQTPLQPFNNALNELFSVFRLQSLAILALPLMLIQTNSGYRMPKWLGYIAYPGHLLILWLLTQIL